MADTTERLKTAEVVQCVLCQATFKGSEFDEHDSSPTHQRNKGRFLVRRAVQKVDGGYRCTGPVGLMRGNALLDR